MSFHVEIYYFSGSGNSLAVAKALAANLDAELTSIVSLTSQETVEVTADAIGLVFPTYDFKPPEFVEAFVRKLTGLGGRYVFAAGTYGIAPGKSLRRLAGVVEACDGRLAGGFAIAMPHTGIGSARASQEQRDARLREAKGKVERVAQYVRDRSEGTIESSRILRDLFQPGIRQMIPSLFKFAGRALFKGMDSLALTASPDCDGCGLCARICPRANIDLVERRPVWGDRCLNCFACLHWCPKAAISLGGTMMDVGHYHHPEVKISDMLQQRGP